MYQIVQSFVRDNRNWQSKNLNEVMMVDILTNFDEVHINIDEDGVVQNWRPMTSEWYAIVYSSGYTLLEWVAHCNHNNIRLDMTSQPFSMGLLKRVSSYEAQAIGFKCTRANSYINPDSEANLVGNDIRFNREGTDYSKFVDNVLVSVNGIIHPTSSSDFGFFAKYGYQSISHSHLYDVNMINFEELGGFKIQRLPFNSRYTQGGVHSKIYNNCCFDMQHDITDKVIGVVLDGYLHLLDDVISIVGQTQFKLNWGRVPIRKRAIVAEGNPPGKSELRSTTNITEDLVTSDEWLLDIIESPFSFLLIFNRTDITKSHKELITTELPGSYFYPTDIDGPVFTGQGETYSYHKQRDNSSYENAREEHTLINLPLTGSYPSAIETGLGSRHQHLGTGTYVGGEGFEMPVVRNVQFHVLPEEF